MDSQDLRALRAALDCLPRECRYHGAGAEPHAGLIHREACCDTGIPARRRTVAEDVLRRLEATHGAR